MGLKTDLLLKFLLSNFNSENIQENAKKIKDLTNNHQFSDFIKNNRKNLEDTIKELRKNSSIEVYESVKEFFNGLMTDLDGGKETENCKKTADCCSTNKPKFPAINIERSLTTNDLYICIIVPGYAKDEIKIRIVEDELIVEGRPETPTGYEDIHTEFEIKDFARKISIEKFLKTHDFEKCATEEYLGAIFLIVPPIEPVKKESKTITIL